MRDLAVRTAVAAVVSAGLVSAGLVLGGAGIAAAGDSVDPSLTTTTSTTGPPSSTATPPTSATPTPPSIAPQVAGDLGRDCLGIVTGVLVVTGPAAGETVTVLVEDGDGVLSTQVVTTAGETVVPVRGVRSDDDELGVSVLFGGDIVTPEALLPIADVCTGAGTIVLDRDCATPDVVVATVEVSGLTGSEHVVGFLGGSGERDVVLASEVVTAIDGTLSGVFPLRSADGSIPLGELDGISLVVDGDTLAVAFVDEVQLATCIVPTQPVPTQPVPTQPVVTPQPVAPVHPVLTPAPVAGQAPVAAAPARTATPAQPAALARTGTDAGSLLLLAGVFLVLGGLTTLAARRTTR